ncbi:MAG: hypothetical protein ACRD88_03635 [Terriglobia bacterium]
MVARWNCIVTLGERTREFFRQVPNSVNGLGIVVAPAQRLDSH